MPLTATGSLSSAVAALVTLLSNVPAFQTFTGTDSAADALASIYTGEAGFPIDSISITGTTLTVKTREPHNLTEGQEVEISGASTGPQAIAGIDGPQTIASVPDDLHFTIMTAIAAEATLYPVYAFVIGAFPVAVVMPPESGAQRTNIIGTGGASVTSGTLEIAIVADTSTIYANDPINSVLEAQNWAGELVDGLAQTSDSGDLMVLNSVELAQGPEFVHRGEQDDSTNRFERWRALIRVTWGLEG